MKPNRLKSMAERFAHAITVFTGSTSAFAGALGTVVLWAALGSLFHYSDSWQLVINTGTTIITFLMVFLIQRTQNKDSRAIQLKLDELVAAIGGASNRLVNVEDLTEDELDVLHRHYEKLADMAKREGRLLESHSIDEAKRRHQLKSSRGKMSTKA